MTIMGACLFINDDRFFDPFSLFRSELFKDDSGRPETFETNVSFERASTISSDIDKYIILYPRRFF